MKITVHCVVKNEDIWVWYAINSVLPFVDKVLIFDTGSTDNTVEIIKTIKSSKIIFEEKGEVDREGLVKLRQEQIDRTKTDWFLIVDGDEVWSKDELLGLFKVAKKSPNGTVAVFNKVRNCIGDIYHYLPEELGQYNIAGVKGNLNIRLIKKTKDIKIEGSYPLEYYFDKNGPIQDQDDRLLYSKNWYLHTSFLKRSTKDLMKVSGSFGRSKVWEKGLRFGKKQLPEVLFEKRPLLVPDPLIKRGKGYEIVSTMINPLLKIKRSIRKHV